MSGIVYGLISHNQKKAAFLGILLPSIWGFSYLPLYGVSEFLWSFPYFEGLAVLCGLSGWFSGIGLNNKIVKIVAFYLASIVFALSAFFWFALGIH